MKKFGQNNHQDGNRFFSKPQLYDAVCAECGKSCQIPFRPTGDRPVYCSDCFEKSGGREGGQKFERRSTERRDFRGSESGRRDFHDRGSERKEMFEAVCDECGRDCEVPFKPTGEKPVYCSSCFDKRGGKSAPRADSHDFKKPAVLTNGITTEQFAQLNTKLDKILKMLEPAAAEIVNEEPVEIKEITMDDVALAPAKSAVKKKTTKKAVTKKKE